MQYAFGDSDVAAGRLRVLSEVFAESSATFLRDVVPAAPALAIDLGCGPGYSTHFLAGLLGPARTVGLDNSEHFICLDRTTEAESVRFLLHDVTKVPFPVAPADLMYCRYLLTHLTDPLGVVARWTGQLRPGGLLAMEEVEDIQTDHPVFRQYLQIVSAMLESQSNDLYIGRRLADFAGTDDLRPQVSRTAHLRVANAPAARMFLPNVRAWKDRPFIRANYARELIDRLEADLGAVLRDPPERVDIIWFLRQVVLRRM